MGKPTDQVGFTKTFNAFGKIAVLIRGVTEENYSIATCPVGAVLVGGGYELYDQTPGSDYQVTDLRIVQNRATPNDQPTTWTVTGRMVGNTDTKEGFYAVATCAQ